MAKATQAKTYTPKDIAEATGRDPKQIRGYLRKEYTRDLKVKNTSWSISAKDYNEVVGHFKGLDKGDAKEKPKAKEPKASPAKKD